MLPGIESSFVHDLFCKRAPTPDDRKPVASDFWKSGVSAEAHEVIAQDLVETLAAEAVMCWGVVMRKLMRKE